MSNVHAHVSVSGHIRVALDLMPICAQCAPMNYVAFGCMLGDIASAHQTAETANRQV